MPTFIIKEGIKIEYFFNEHSPPHIHASYGEHEALIVIKDQSVYEGTLPANKLKLAKKIVKENMEDLLFLFIQNNPQLKRKL